MVGDPKRQPLWVSDVWSQSCDLTSKTQDERLNTTLEKTLRYELTVGIQEEAQDIITMAGVIIIVTLQSTAKG
jgi:hypothetical protein